MSHTLKPFNPAIDTLEQLFVKANNDLNYVHHKLEIESSAREPGQVDPYRLLLRIQKIQDELPVIEDGCRKLLVAKQEVIDKTKEILVANRALLRRLQARVGAPICCDDDDAVYGSFLKVLHEWSDQLQSGEGTDSAVIEDLNQKLLSSIIGK
ncbi:hypothetical protein GOP47_0005007 [Adiantum capillus-veneris]|uniref:Protein FAM33A n=1 Tax=Adiantum capillus-veneris TaxID=13818 RepID=A0A9D4V4K1_ADICA|nr:hypothetical protein GOP47_0005007 [Adiantum capillus-veneris]